MYENVNAWMTVNLVQSSKLNMFLIQDDKRILYTFMKDLLFM